MSWRQTVAFQDTEVVVRRSRDWDQKVLKPGSDAISDAKSEAREIFDEAVRHATSLEVMGGNEGMERKTGYALMDREWDLDWQCMIDAHSLIDGKYIPVEAFKTKVLIYSEAYGWVQWTDGIQDDGGQVEQAKIVRFKNIWTGMGKESLFFRWIEIVGESGTVEWSEEARKAELRIRARRMIKDEGLDFDAVLEAIGGWNGWPGLE